MNRIGRKFILAEKSNCTALELGRVLVRFNHIAGRIVTANHGVR